MRVGMGVPVQRLCRGGRNFFVFKSACPAGGNDARWPPLRVDEEAGDLVGGENSHAVELGQRRRCCCDRSSAGVTTGVPGLHKSF